MTDEEFLDSIASELGQDKFSIQEKVRHYKERGLRTIGRKLFWYWFKENESFTLSAEDHTVDLAGEFEDIYIPKFFWTTSGAVNSEDWPEKRFRREYPNPTDTGTPIIAVWLTGHTWRFHPIPESDTTIYVSYYYMPDNTSIDDLHEKFVDVLEYYVLMCFETEGNKYQKLYYESLNEMIADAKPSEDWTPEMLWGESQENVRDVQSGLERM